MRLAVAVPLCVRPIPVVLTPVIFPHFAVRNTCKNKIVSPSESFVLFYVSCTVDPEPQDILQQLQALEGISVTELETEDHFQRLFEIRITQPVDHNQPNAFIDDGLK